MTMLPNARRRARRSGVLTLTLAAFVPLAIPVTASASTIPGYPPPGAFVSYPVGNEFLNQVNADSVTNQKTVFKVKFGLGEGVSPIVNAVNRAVALTSRCDNCNAIAIGFQVVTTTDRDLLSIHATNVAVATNYDCVVTCDAEADAYQVVVATDTPQAMPFGQLLDPSRLSALYKLRAEFMALPNSGLSLPQIQAKCQDLANQAMTILEDARYAGPDVPAVTAPAMSPAVPGAGTDTELTGSDRPVVDLYHDFQFRPFSGG
jgi:hypothetical protein